jgi:hypothetical protein
LKQHPPDRPFRAVYFAPDRLGVVEIRPGVIQIDLDGDLWVFVDACDGTVLGVMAMCRR